jgi:phage terminase Nu1 subunit (DNA packaging protein)
MNSSQFAAQQGFSPAYVTKLVQQGIIERDDNGQIDPDAAMAAIDAMRDPAKPIRRTGRPVNQMLRTAADGGITGGSSSNTGTLTVVLLKQRIKTEFERGKLAELERKQREDELVNRREVEEAAFTLARNLRDALFNIPSRVATMFAAETSAHRIHQIMEDELRKALLDLLAETDTEVPEGTGTQQNSQGSTQP